MMTIFLLSTPAYHFSRRQETNASREKIEGLKIIVGRN